MDEKKISEVTVRLSDTLKRDMQDLAAHEDRTLSDTIRIALEMYLYGAKHRVDALCSHGQSSQTMRGEP